MLISTRYQCPKQRRSYWHSFMRTIYEGVGCSCSFTKKTYVKRHRLLHERQRQAARPVYTTLLYMMYEGKFAAWLRRRSCRRRSGTNLRPDLSERLKVWHVLPHSLCCSPAGLLVLGLSVLVLDCDATALCAGVFMRVKMGVCTAGPFCMKRPGGRYADGRFLSNAPGERSLCDNRLT